jgi:GNAT superfamily N-acetyltransferase
MASQSDYLGLFAQPQAPAGLFAPPQQAAGMFAAPQASHAPQASMRPYQPTIREQLGNAVYDFMMARGLPSTAEQYRGVAQGAADFVPGLGDAVGSEEAGRAFNAGDYLGAAVGAGGVVLGAVPVVGDAAAKGLRGLGLSLEKSSEGVYRARKPTGEAVAVLRLKSSIGGPQNQVADVRVDDAYRRKGVASALYDDVSEDIGETIIPSDNLSYDAFRFWKKRNPEAVSESIYNFRDDLIGKKATALGKYEGEIVDVRNNHVMIKDGRGMLPVYRHELISQRLIPIEAANDKMSRQAAFDVHMADYDAKVAKSAEAMSGALKSEGIYMARDGDRTIAVSPSTTEPGYLQYTRFRNGEPQGHMTLREDEAATELARNPDLIQFRRNKATAAGTMTDDSGT